MELSKYLFPLRKWWWLLAASALIAVIFSSVSVLRQPKLYQARTTLLIGTTITDPNPSSNELQLGSELAGAYADLANREIVRNATMNALHMDELPDYIAQAIPNTQLIEITVNDIDPERAPIVANQLAAQLVLLSPTGPKPEDQGRLEFINEQLNNLEVEIKATQDDIANLQQQLSTMVSAQQINDTERQISSLQTKLQTIQNNYGLLLSNTQQGATNTLTIIESAGPTARPIGSNKGLTVLLAAVIGLALAASEAYLLEFLLDNTLKSADDVKRFFSAPIIGHIFEQEERKDEGNRLYTADDPGQPIAEAFRVLRTNIELSQAGRPLKTILVTSPGIGDGKTSVAANLALSMSQRDKVVVLLDADLRRPNVHEFFEVANDQGLVNLVSDGASITDVLQFKKVAVLTSGGTPINPTELLSSEKMDQLLSKLEKAADVVIIDGPPFLVADAMVMASKVDGVLLVIRPGHTRRSLAQGASDQIKLSRAKVLGLVLNRIPLRGADYYAGSSYAYSYYGGSYGNGHEGRQTKPDLESLRKSLLPLSNKATDFMNKATDFMKPRLEVISNLHHKYLVPLVVAMVLLVILAGVFSLPVLLLLPALYVVWLCINIYWESRNRHWRGAASLLVMALVFSAALWWLYSGIAK